MLVAGLFAVLTLPRLLRHELWRDEAWLWLVATDSESLRELFGHLARSGQGYLFPLACFAVARWTASPLALQLLHLAVGAAAAWLFVRQAPFPRAERLLFVAGYFPFWEYAVLSRHYVLGALLLWAACAAARHDTPAGRLALGAALGLLCQTTVYGFLLAAAVGVGWWLARRGAAADPPPPPDGSRAPAATLAAAGLAGAGAVAGLVQLQPLPGTSFATAWRLAWDPELAVAAAATPFRGLLPLPRPSLHFWNTSVLDPWPAALAVASLLVVALAVWLVAARRASLVAFLLGGSALLAFSYVKLLGASRHLGHWWLLLVAALWVAGGTAGWRGPRRWALRALLALHLPAAFFASAVDLARPFSNGPATAQALRERGLAGAPLFGHREPPAAAVALPLGRPLWAPSRETWARYPDWGPRQRELTEPEVRCAARSFAARQGRDVVLVVNRALPPWAEVQPLGAHTGAINPTEDFHLYRLPVERLAATAAAADCPDG